LTTTFGKPLTRANTLAEWLQRIERLHPRAIDLGLERVTAVLAAMKLAEPAFTVITIGGTNGKGSTATMCDAMLRDAGYCVGTYMSPHLTRYNERVRIGGRMVSDEVLCQSFERVEAHRGETQLTYFEYGTIAALDIFSRESIDIAILEVGMGGRLDAVNAIDPTVAVVTSIGIDHVEWLGPDRESIGREKAGIFRRGRPAICGDLDPPRSLIESARQTGATLYRIGHDFSASPEAQGWSYRFGERLRAGLPLPLLRGEYQLRNAACVLTVLELLSDRQPVTQSQVRHGLVTAFVPGRFQLLPGRATTILDVAHNEQAAHALAINLSQHRVSGRTFAVFGMLIDKPIAQVARAVAGEVDVWHAVTLAGPRGATAEQVAAALSDAGSRGPITTFDTVAEGFESARAAAGPNDRILVFGSFYTVGDILAHLNIGPA